MKTTLMLELLVKTLTVTETVTEAIQITVTVTVTETVTGTVMYCLKTISRLNRATVTCPMIYVMKNNSKVP